MPVVGPRSRATLAGVLIAALCAGGPASAGAAKAKPKKKTPSVAAITKTVGAPVPQDAPSGPSTPLYSTIDIGKRFKGKVVGDVNLTGITTLGSAAGAAGDLTLRLTGPTGRTVTLISSSGDTNLGPLTLDDETRVSACTATVPCADPDRTLGQPFAGTANLDVFGGNQGPLSVFDGRRMRGAWTLTAFDTSAQPTTSILASWGLRVTAAKPAEVSAPKGKTKKGPSVFEETNSTSLAVPDETPGGVVTPVTSTIAVPKTFKGRVVGDIDVTGIRTSGSAASAAGDLFAFLVAPNGRLVPLWAGIGDQSIGPWTLDDDTRRSICNSSNPVCLDPDQSLLRPFAGTSNLYPLFDGEGGPLSRMRGVPMAGPWKLIVQDMDNLGTNVLTSWGLRITAAKPVAGSRVGGKPSVAAAAKKGKGKPKGSVAVTKSVGQAVPQDAPAGPSTPLRSTISITNKAFKGATVGDVNVTGISTSGSAAFAALDLTAKLTAPNGRTIRLFTAVGDVNLGPWTLDEDVPVSACDSLISCFPPFTTPRPFAGTTNQLRIKTANSGLLSALNGSPVRGRWTFTVFDGGGAATTNVLNSWGLRIAVAKPVG